MVAAFESKGKDNRFTYPEFVAWLFGEEAAALYGVQVNRSDSLFRTKQRVAEGKSGEELYSFEEGSSCFLVLRPDGAWSYLPLPNDFDQRCDDQKFADGVQGTYAMAIPSH